MKRIRLAAAAAAAGVAVFAALVATAGADNTAQNQQPFPLGQLYGGGKISNGSIDAPPDQLASIRVSQDRTQLNFLAVVTADCGGGGFAHRAPVAYNIPLKPDGTFSGSIPYHDQGPAGHEDGTFSYSGKFNGTDPVKGTLRLAFVTHLNKGGGTTCDTGSVKYEMRDPSTSPGSGKLKRRAAYYGLQSDGRQIEFRVHKKGKKSSELYFDTFFDKSQCTGQTPGLDKMGSSPGFKIKKGKFKSSGSAFLFDDPGSPDFKWTIKGKFGKKRVNGTLQYQADVHNAQNQVVSHCTSPKLKIQLERG